MADPTNDVGAQGEHLAAAALMAAGCQVLFPVAHDIPYDLIADTGTQRLRVQVKTRLGPGNIDLRHSSHSKHYKKGEFDFFALVAIGINLFEDILTYEYSVCLVPFDECNKRSWAYRSGYTVAQQLRRLREANQD